MKVVGEHQQGQASVTFQLAVAGLKRDEEQEIIQENEERQCADEGQEFVRVMVMLSDTRLRSRW